MACIPSVDPLMIRTSGALVEPVAASYGTLRTRSEVAADADFLFVLYASVRGPEMAAMAVDDVVRQRLLRMQFDAMTHGYHATFPSARYEVIELNDTPIGRLIVNIEPVRAHIIYIALLPEWRNRRIGEAVMISVLDEPRRLGAVCEATVARDNAGSLRLWSKLGFEAREQASMDVLMEWRAQ